jgi:hypothetical protein
MGSLHLWSPHLALVTKLRQLDIATCIEFSLWNRIGAFDSIRHWFIYRNLVWRSSNQINMKACLHSLRSHFSSLGVSRSPELLVMYFIGEIVGEGRALAETHSYFKASGLERDPVIGKSC